MSVIESLANHLTPKQQSILKEFRERVADALESDRRHDDMFLLRWLKARNFDIKKAENMLRKSMLWRKNYGTDDVLNWDPPKVLRKHWPGGAFGFDKLGHPILWQLSSDFDAKGLLKSAKRSDIIKYHIWRMEYISKLQREQSQKLGKPIGCAMHLSDLSGFSLKMVFSPGITDITKEVFALTEANYPEHLYRSYVINAPGVFAVFYNIIRPFVSEETKAKLQFLGRNWREFLTEKVVDSDQLPVHWGGTARAPDDKCSDHVSHGGKVPEHYYVQDKISLDRGRLTEVTIPRGGSHKLHFDIVKPGSVIRWAFETDTYDIGFEISYLVSDADGEGTGRGSDGEWQEFRSLSRVNCQLVPEDGNICCRLPGKYMLKFDNSFSWVHSKKLYYEIEVMEPVSDPLFSDVQMTSEEDIILESTYL